MILGAAGDPGGSRALLPVFAYLEEKEICFQIFPHGFLHREAPGHWPRIDPEVEGDFEWLASAASRGEVQAYIFGSSLKDKFALKLAEKAKALGIPVIHVLDHWTNYLERIRLDDESLVIPDIYTVIDRKAFETAIQVGIPSTVLRISGQPAFYRGPVEDLRIERNSKAFSSKGRNKKHILFISEPVSIDQGTSAGSPSYRGYTEEDSLAMFCRLLKRYKADYFIEILPHPREDRNKLEKMFDKHNCNLEGRVGGTGEGRQMLAYAAGVAGMASVLLYEAWLIGIPVLSLQPGLKIPNLDYLKDKEGCFTVTKEEDLYLEFEKWLEAMETYKGLNPRDDYLLHSKAAERICQIILSLSSRKNSP